jgi:ornithine--oxo-acid transaminase
VIVDEDLPARSAELGEYTLNYLKKVRSRHIVDVRGKGLWIGIELTGRARPFCETLRQRGLLCKETHSSVIRLAPPLVIEKADLDWGLAQICEVLEDKSAIPIERKADLTQVAAP